MSAEEVRARVEAFVADFHSAWQRSGRVPIPAFNPCTDGPAATFDSIAWAAQGPSDFAAWERELARLVDVHFVAGARTGHEGYLSGKPAHDPAGERIVSVDVRRTRADVRTVFPDVTVENHFTYRMSLTEDGWRISRIVHTFAPGEDRLLSRDEAERLVAAMDPARATVPVPDDLAAGVTALFSGRSEVAELGSVATAGVLTVHDLGWVRADPAPLDRRVPAGSYPVELARDSEGTEVALRLRFADDDAVTRLPATRVGADNVVGVDAGNVAILDFLALASCSESRVTELFQDGLGGVLSLAGGAPDAVCVRSGYGDGAYPVYWGVGADGTATDLVVDFMVHVEDVTTTHTVPWRLGPVDDPALARHDVEVLVEGAGVVFRYRGASGSTLVRDLRVLAADGRPVSGRDGGVLVQAGTSERYWTPEGRVPEGASLEVTLSHGYRHA